MVRDQGLSTDSTVHTHLENLPESQTVEYTVQSSTEFTVQKYSVQFQYPVHELLKKKAMFTYLTVLQ